MDPLVKTLQAVVGSDAVLSDPAELLVYECDGLTQHKHIPRAVVFPGSTEETCEVMQVLNHARVPFTPRGAGTGLSGGALALERGVVVELARMRRILRLDEANRLAVVQTGVVNAHVSRAVASLGLHYVPDPSSQPACTIGGNIGENAGGVHCLKYGTTTDHVLALRVVLADGAIVELGSASGEQPGYDLRGVFIGSEGTFGIATEATLRLVPIPPSVRTLLAEFAEVDQASHAVSAIIAAGLMPAGLEMMDREIIRAVEASSVAAGLPPDAGAALLIELDGLEAGIDDEAERVKSICLQYGARNCRLAQDEAERKKLWAARKGAFGAIGRIAPDAMIQDAVVPRSRLPQIMADAYRIAARHRLRIANVFHAGDGNLHPLICFDSRSAEEVARVKEAGRELMETCVRAGGSITGEHGVGLDKRDLLSLIFSEPDLELMLRVRAAFDPAGLMNPGKIVPLLKGCGEARGLTENGPANVGGVRERRNDGVGRDPTLEEARAEPVSNNVSHDEESASPRDTNSGDFVAAGRCSPHKIAKEITAIIGDENVRICPYTSTSSVSSSASLALPAFLNFPVSSPKVFALPASIEEAAQVLRLASRNRWTVVPAGKCSWLDAGNPLTGADVLIGTWRLNRIIEHEPADLIAITEAGVLLRDLNHRLMQEGQWLPIDATGHGEGTIGGIIATGTSGPQRSGYGPTRGFVIGLKVLLADGSLIKAGGRVVKNVAGYDLCKLFTGSYGTLGLIVEANFKLRPRPELEASVLASGPPGSLIAVAQMILKLPLFPAAVEMLSHTDLLRTEQPVLLTRFAGNDKTVKAQTENACTILKSANDISNVRVIENDSDIWERLALPLTTSKGVSWRAHVPPALLPGLIDLVYRSHNGAGDMMRWQAGIADGRLQAGGEFEPETNVDVLSKLRDECRRYKGSLFIENAPRQIKEQFPAWGEFGNSTFVMQRIKQQLDPEGILSPGRFGF